MMRKVDSLLDQYGELLRQVDQWFARCRAAYPDAIRCGQGCSGCCRGLFDITLLDGWYLRRGYALLPDARQRSVRRRAMRRLAEICRQWPDFPAPYLLNYRPEAEWEQLMPDDDEAPCIFLDSAGRCLIYDHRPMTCRLHGLPLVDEMGEVLVDEWCTENFPAADPLVLPLLRGNFTGMFRTEVDLMREFTGILGSRQLSELDTFIPLAVLVDYDTFDWHTWLHEAHIVINNPVA
jgi:Fe-S-cluster containining protein